MGGDSVFRGIVHGRTIEIDSDLGFAEGQSVLVVIQPVSPAVSGGDGLKQSFGGWADDVEDLDAYLEWSRRQRKTSRTGIDR